MKIHPVRADLFCGDGQTDRQTDRQRDTGVMKLMVAFCIFVDVPEN